MIDDEEDVGLKLAETMEMPFFSCLLRSLKHHRCHFDFVIADLAMSKLNGLEFLQLASQRILNSQKKLIMTGLAEIDGKAIENDPKIALLHRPLGLQKLRKKWGALCGSTRVPQWANTSPMRCQGPRIEPTSRQKSG